MNKLDKVDMAILDCLQENAKMSTKQIAEQVGLSTTPTFERVKRLEREGVINKYTVELDRKKIGRSLCVFCHVTLREHKLEHLEGFERKVVGLSQVEYCYHLAGNHDYLLFISVSDMEEYEHFLKNELTAIPSIANVHSSFVLSDVRSLI